MPFQTTLEAFTQGVPAWIVTGTILVGGYMYDKAQVSAERLATLETRTDHYEEDVREIKAAVTRIEDIIIGRE